MFDLGRLGELAADFLGQNAADVDVGGVLQQLSEQGIDPSQFQELGADELLKMLSENGIDPSELGADQLGALAENFGVTEQLPDWISQSTDRSG